MLPPWASATAQDGGMRAFQVPFKVPLDRLTAVVGAGLLLCTVGARAQDLPGTAACRTALQALAQAEEALLARAAASAPADDSRHRAATAQLFPLRQQVADACLGGMTTSPPPSQRSGVGALPARPAAPLAPAARMPQTPVPVVTIPVPRFDAPVTITHCNGMNCVASDGSTLTRVGPNVIGPKGPCTVAGNQVRCP
jgi:hypothetical protein